MYFKENSHNEQSISEYLRRERWEKFWMNSSAGLHMNNTTQLCWTLHNCWVEHITAEADVRRVFLVSYSYNRHGIPQNRTTNRLFAKLLLCILCSPVSQLVSCRLLVCSIKFLLMCISPFLVGPNTVHFVPCLHAAVRIARAGWLSFCIYLSQLLYKQESR
jgi:hypothetical protein